MLAVADDVTVLRNGAVIWSGPAAEATKASLVTAMLVTYALEDRSHPAWQRLKAEELLAQQLSQMQSKRERDALRAPALKVAKGTERPLPEQLIAALVRGAWDVLSHPRWLVSTLLRSSLCDGVPTFAHYPPEFRSAVTRPSISKRIQVAQSLSWDDIAALRKLWPGPLVLKGVLRVEDARRAMDCGLDGVVVSSHGARNVDSAPAPIDVLPDIADAVGKHLTVLMDSGVRRGSDIVKAICLGADWVGLGRLYCYGLAAAGAAGIERVIELLEDDDDCTLTSEQLDEVFVVVALSLIEICTVRISPTRPARWSAKKPVLCAPAGSARNFTPYSVMIAGAAGSEPRKSKLSCSIACWIASTTRRVSRRAKSIIAIF